MVLKYVKNKQKDKHYECVCDFIMDNTFEQLDVEQSDVDGKWYLKEECPHKTDEEKLLELKKEKHTENQRKLDVARTSHVFTVMLQDKECVFDTKDKTQNDLNSAAISATLGQPWAWTTNNRVTLFLTAEDVQTVATAYAQAVNEDIQKWVYYDELIDVAETLDELNNIEIIYE